MPKRLIVGLLVLVPTVAQSETWTPVVVETRLNVAIERSTIKRVSSTSGIVKSAWFKYDYKPPIKPGEPYSMVELARFNCDEETVATVSETEYSKTGTVLRNNVTPLYSLRYQPIPPGTVGAQMLNVVCDAD